MPCFTRIEFPGAAQAADVPVITLQCLGFCVSLWADNLLSILPQLVCPPHKMGIACPWWDLFVLDSVALYPSCSSEHEWKWFSVSVCWVSLKKYFLFAGLVCMCSERKRWMSWWEKQWDGVERSQAQESASLSSESSSDTYKQHELRHVTSVRLSLLLCKWGHGTLVNTEALLNWEMDLSAGQPGLKPSGLRILLHGLCITNSSFESPNLADGWGGISHSWWRFKVTVQ